MKVKDLLIEDYRVTVDTRIGLFLHDECVFDGTYHEIFDSPYFDSDVYNYTITRSNVIIELSEI